MEIRNEYQEFIEIVNDLLKIQTKIDNLISEITQSNLFRILISNISGTGYFYFSVEILRYLYDRGEISFNIYDIDLLNLNINYEVSNNNLIINSLHESRFSINITHGIFGCVSTSYISVNNSLKKDLSIRPILSNGVIYYYDKNDGLISEMVPTTPDMWTEDDYAFIKLSS